MRKTFILITAILALVMVINANASDDTDVPVDPSKYTPKMRLSSNSTIDVHEGRTEEVIIELKNVGTGRANNLFVQVVPEPGDPFDISLEIMGGNIVQIGVTKQVKMTVRVKSGAPQNVYPVTISYGYSNDFKDYFEGTDKLNIRVVNPRSESNISLSNFSLTPEYIVAGQTAELSFNYMNKGSAMESYVKFELQGLDTNTVTVPSGLSSKVITDLNTYIDSTMSFTLSAAKDCKSGSYPVKIVTTTRSGTGEGAAQEEIFYVNVVNQGEEPDQEDAIIDVINTAAPTGTFGVGETFNFSFDLINSSQYDANNLLVRATTQEGNPIVPTSQSMVQTKVLKPGEKQRYSFNFAATSTAKTQNYPVAFTIEYDSNKETTEGEKSKISFSHFFGVNIFNPEKEEEKPEDKDEMKDVPKIIINSYSCTPNIVKAGSQFELTMTFLNTHSNKKIQNIKVSLTVTDKEEKKGASIFSPINASNTLFIDEIGPKETVTRSIDYYTIPDAQPQNYSINVDFDYEDAAGKRIEQKEIVGINVSQPPNVETSGLSFPEVVEAGSPAYISFNIVNTGKVIVNNLKVTIDENVPADNKTTFIGNLESGNQEPFEAQLMPDLPGELPVKVVVSYNSATGELFEIPLEFTITVLEPAPMEFDPNAQYEEPDTGFNTKTIAIGVVAVVLIGGGTAAYLIWKKKNKGNDFYE